MASARISFSDRLRKSRMMNLAPGWNAILARFEAFAKVRLENSPTDT